MSRAPQVDNGTYQEKLMLRQTALRALGGATPVVMETHGGVGDLGATLYKDVVDGVVFEKESDRTLVLAHQRPSWAVYEAIASRHCNWAQAGICASICWT